MHDDSDDDLPLAQICDVFINGMDSILLQYPSLWGLPDISQRDSDFATVPLDYPPDDFKNQFGMSRTSFMDLMTKLGRRTNIRCLEKKLLFTLWMLLTHDSYDSVGKRFQLSKSSGHTAFTEIIDAVLHLFDDYVKWPSPSEYSEISESFRERSNGRIPGIVGAIDTAYLRIKKPKEDAEEYRSDGNVYSIALQAVCDHRMLFTNVCVGSPGSFSKHRVFHESKLRNDIDDMISGEYHLVGSVAYPLLRNLVTPFRDTGQLSGAKKEFNKILSKSAVVIAKAIEILKQRFKKLEYLDTNNPELASKIVCSCVTLHNHILMHDDEDTDTTTSITSSENDEYVRNWVAGERTQDRRKAGTIKRNYLMSLCD